MKTKNSLYLILTVSGVLLTGQLAHAETDKRKEADVACQGGGGGGKIVIGIDGRKSIVGQLIHAEIDRKKGTNVACQGGGGGKFAIGTDD